MAQITFDINDTSTWTNEYVIAFNRIGIDGVKFRNLYKGYRHKEGGYLKLSEEDKIKHSKARLIAKKTPLLDKCEFCDETIRLGRHHFAGYDYPEIFVTACPKCHYKIEKFYYESD